MDFILQRSVFRKENTNKRKLEILAMVFFPFTIAGLGMDSVYFTQNYFDSRMLTSIAIILFFYSMFRYADTRLRKLMFTMVFLSFLGELLFCKVFGMYEYRLADIPVYVPFGHSIVYASGYILSKTDWATRNEKVMRIVLPGLISLTLILSGLFLNDIFSLILLPLILWLFRRKKWQSVYHYITVCVFFIEIVGTQYQCWTWAPKIFNYIPSANPPLGAVFFYLCGDVILAKIVDIWKNK